MIDLDEPIAAYWPAFAQNGKRDIPVHLVLSQRSGVAALDTAISNDDAAALERVLRLIEQQRRIGDWGSSCPVGRCGLMLAYRDCTAFLAPVAPWPLPTQNINSLSGTRPTSGRSFPAALKLHASGSNDYTAATYKALGIRRWPRG
jgi:Beta-lactamase